MGRMKELAMDMGLLDDDYIEPMADKMVCTFPPVRVGKRISVHTLRIASRNPEAFLKWCEDRTPFSKRYLAEWQDPIEGYTVHHARYKVADWIVTFLLERGEITQYDYSHITAD
jgi:hypothetical protein